MTRTILRRGLVAAVMVVALAVYGLVTSGTQSLSFKPASASGTAAASKLAVSEAVSPVNGSLNVATQGPGNSLYFYWNVKGTWYGPLGVGAPGTTFSAPDIIAEAQGTNDAGNFDIVAQGPNNSLLLWWDISGTWYGPLGIGGYGSTYSTPSIAAEVNAPYNLDVAAEGPNNTLNLIWDTADDATWHGPLQIDGGNSTFSAPSLSTSSVDSASRNQTKKETKHASGRSSNNFNEIFITNVGSNNDLRAHEWNGQSNAWANEDATNDGDAFSAPSQQYDYSVFEGVNNSLHQAYGFDQVEYTQISGAGTTYSAPTDLNDGRYVVAEGPSNTLYFWISGENGCGFFCGSGENVYQVGAPGTTFSAPTAVVDNNGNVDFTAVGPSGELLAWWQIAGVYYGPVMVAGPGSAFVSNS